MDDGPHIEELSDLESLYHVEHVELPASVSSGLERFPLEGGTSISSHYKCAIALGQM